MSFRYHSYCYAKFHWCLFDILKEAGNKFFTRSGALVRLAALIKIAALPIFLSPTHRALGVGGVLEFAKFKSK